MTQAQYNRLINVDNEPVTYARKRIEAGDLEALLAAYTVAYDLIQQAQDFDDSEEMYAAFLDTYPEPTGI